MEIKLSPAEVTQIATEVVRLMKQQGLVTTTPKASKTANADATPVKGKSTAPTSAKTSAKQSREASPAASASNAETYSIDAAAEIKGYHPNTIRRAIKSGKLKAKLSKDGRYQIRQADLNAFAI
jgi:hypothetical protein